MVKMRVHRIDSNSLQSVKGKKKITTAKVKTYVDSQFLEKSDIPRANFRVRKWIEFVCETRTSSRLVIDAFNVELKVS